MKSHKDKDSRKREPKVWKYSVGEQLGGGIFRGSVETPAVMSGYFDEELWKICCEILKYMVQKDENYVVRFWTTWEQILRYMM